MFTGINDMGECRVYIASRGNVMFIGIIDMGECHVYTASIGNVIFTGINAISVSILHKSSTHL